MHIPGDTPFHFIALPVLVMLLILDWNSIFTNTEQRPGRGLLTACVSICGMAMMFAFDRKLTKGVIIGSVVAMILTSLARSMDAWMKDLGDEQHNIRWQSPFTLPILVVVISAAMIRRYEYPLYTPAGPVYLGGILAINIASVVTAWWLNSDFFTHYASSEEDIDSVYMGGNEIRHLLTPIAVVGLVTLGRSCVPPPFLVSVWQHVGFLIGLSAIYIASHLIGRTAEGDAEKNYELLAEAESRKAPTVQNRSKRMPIALSVTLLAGMLLIVIPIHWSGALSRPHNAILNSPTPAWSRNEGSQSLDCVISRYDETATSLADTLTPLLNLESTFDRTTQVIVYNTGEEDLNSTFHNDLQQALPSGLHITITHRQNVGRESAAFLHHITTQWDNLADHTLFMQAQPHEPAHMRRLLRNYFVPQTGLLSLSPLQDVCTDCKNCWDHSTWSESQSILEDIYSRANKGAKCKSFVLTYRGQFLASRKRIPAAGKQVFEDLLNHMVDPGSEEHSTEYKEKPWLPQKLDSLNSPLFGYTSERIWGVLMGCSDPRLALTCPSRISAAMKVLTVGESGLRDCQCLDDHDGS